MASRLLRGGAMRHAGLGILLVAGCWAGDEPIEAPAGEPLPVELGEGDIVHAGGIAVEVPAPGETVAIDVDHDDGTTSRLAIEHTLDDGVRVLAPADEPIVFAASSTAPCEDGAYNLSGHKWTSTYKWRFHASSTPSANSKDNVETALRRSASSITGSRNNCNLTDSVSATHSYLGRTSRAPNIKTTDSGIACSARDTHNVTGFGSLPTGVLGVACSWSSGGIAVEGDVKLNTRYRWFALGVPSSCSSKFGVLAVATHEYGHVFGMGHVSESSHPHLTMSTAIGPCTNAAYTLGLGDIRGLRSLY